ncbi:VOC family protein [Serpentinicella alkaliphila]|uniref:Lactoylglutathione lyase/methylmalonyl-CoA/ethylmalonyl-CoA epimerase n=1 Tax=Serpentinicella alkaliphila TaxID=1734049 RepID=A0A4R2T6U1_9FIRM|nr:VOC family protein [Serpentinicella alkaliphila]QUH25877.1 VOC family protein [Serpentinicella alkaliphila]TCP97196.1 lactoylglutathione lyase/methylmalonyl-CoA/ethylmalonyl-CoA epimerase [Serpentinicella alkaliphila]
MKPMRMHHVGIILPTLEAAYKWLETFDLEVDYKGFVEAYQADLIFTKYTENESPVELIIPREGSVLKNFNNGKGGIAHIAFECEDVEAIRQDFESRGIEMLEGSAVPGTSDIIVNFVRPKYTQGILVEYVQTVAPIQRD